MISQETQEILADIFENSERPDKMTVSIDNASKSVTVVYEDIDEQWLDEVSESMIKQTEISQ